mmetsp:Transcript_5950/g.7776  ORF Transcript_5950/g.7776 Transcript_5950/m.7776 type:complete len:155 (-) Transcript_5950:911-1375(-)
MEVTKRSSALKDKTEYSKNWSEFLVHELLDWIDYVTIAHSSRVSTTNNYAVKLSHFHRKLQQSIPDTIPNSRSYLAFLIRLLCRGKSKYWKQNSLASLSLYTNPILLSTVVECFRQLLSVRSHETAISILIFRTLAEFNSEYLMVVFQYMNSKA